MKFVLNLYLFFLLCFAFTFILNFDLANNKKALVKIKNYLSKTNSKKSFFTKEKINSMIEKRNLKCNEVLSCKIAVLNLVPFLSSSNLKNFEIKFNKFESFKDLDFINLKSIYNDNSLIKSKLSSINKKEIIKVYLSYYYNYVDILYAVNNYFEYATGLLNDYNTLFEKLFIIFNYVKKTIDLIKDNEYSNTNFDNGYFAFKVTDNSKLADKFNYNNKDVNIIISPNPIPLKTNLIAIGNNIKTAKKINKLVFLKIINSNNSCLSYKVHKDAVILKPNSVLEVVYHKKYNYNEALFIRKNISGFNKSKLHPSTEFYVVEANCLDVNAKKTENKDYSVDAANIIYSIYDVYSNINKDNKTNVLKLEKKKQKYNDKNFVSQNTQFKKKMPLELYDKSSETFMDDFQKQPSSENKKAVKTKVNKDKKNNKIKSDKAKKAKAKNSKEVTKPKVKKVGKKLDKAKKAKAKNTKEVTKPKVKKVCKKLDKAKKAKAKNSKEVTKPKVKKVCKKLDKAKKAKAKNSKQKIKHKIAA